MSTFNLLDVAKNYFNNELVNKASAALGESEGSITKALSAAIPSIIGGLADKATTVDGANEVAQMATAEHNDGILDVIAGFLHKDGNAEQKSSGLLNSLFTGEIGQKLTSLLSNFAGVKSSSITSLLSMALPTVLGLLGRYTAENNIQASGLSSMLQEQKDLAMAALPAGFSLTGLSETATTAHAAPPQNTVHTTASDHNNHTNDKGAGKMNLLLPLILLIGLVLGCWYLLRNGCGNKAETAQTTEQTTSEATSKTETNITTATTTTAAQGMLDTLTGDFMYNEGALTNIVLPNNAGELKVGANSTEAKLVAFLNDKNATIDTVKGNWFDFTNVHFKTGKSELTDASNVQLTNLVAIAKAYPTATFKFGGYTDNTGNAASNLALSQKRAEAVGVMVIKMGAAKTSIVGAEGYGIEYPIGDNATAEGRAMNRRVSVRVKSK